MTNALFELPEMTPCVFCELIAGRLDKGLVEETALTLTIVNIRQFEVGQVLVIPRRHAPTILDLTDEEAPRLWTLYAAYPPRLSERTRPTV